MRTASNSRPLMRRKPICSASPNWSDGPRRASIMARSLAVKVKNASISKPLSSRGNCLSPRNVACQWFIASLPGMDTIAPKNDEQQRIVLVTKNRSSLYDFRQILPSLLEAKMRVPPLTPLSEKPEPPLCNAANVRSAPFLEVMPTPAPPLIQSMPGPTAAVRDSPLSGTRHPSIRNIGDAPTCVGQVHPTARAEPLPYIPARCAEYFASQSLRLYSVFLVVSSGA